MEYLIDPFNVDDDATADKPRGLRMKPAPPPEPGSLLPWPFYKPCYGVVMPVDDTAE